MRSTIWIAVACLLSLNVPARASGEEAELAARLSDDATKLIEGLLGPGKARVLVRVEGERSETVTETNVDTPVEKPPVASEDGPSLPGYTPSSLLEKAFTYVQHDQEKAARTSFVVQKISVSVLLDATVPEPQAEAVRKVVTDMLRLNQLRGDNLTIVRASLQPVWRSILFSPQVLPTVVGHAILVLGFLLVAGVIYRLGVRGIRTVADAALRAQSQLQSQSQSLPIPEPAIPGLEEGGGEPPSLLELEEGAPQLEASEAFGFLEKIDADEVREALLQEPVEELALFFAHLSDQKPEQSTLLFSGLPPATQLEISRAMVRISRAEPDLINAFESRLKDRIESRLRGHEKLGALLSRLAPEDRSTLLGGLDAEALQRVESTLVTFEDLASAREEDLRRLVTAIPFETWAPALRETDPRFTARIVEMLPAGMRDAFRESVEQPQSREKTLEARSRILSEALKLAREGHIQLKKRPTGAPIA